MDKDLFQLEEKKSQYQAQLRAKYTMLFKDGIGREVLGDILALCGFPGATGDIYYGLDADKPDEIGRFNVGIDIARKAGVLRAIGEHILALNIIRE